VKLRSLWFNALLIILALGTSAVVIATRDSITSGEVEGRTQHLFPGFRPGEITTIRVEASGQRLVLQKQLDEAGSAWLQVEPQQGPVEAARVDELLRAAHFSTFIRRVEPEDVQREQLGLSPPGASVVFETKDRKYVVRLGGNAEAPRGAKYLELSGAPEGQNGVFVVSANTREELGVAPDAFLVRQVVPYAGSALKRLTIAQAQESVVLEQVKPGEFRLAGAYGNARVARDAMERLLLGLARSQVDPALSQAEARAALGSDALQLTLTPRDSNAAPVHLELGGTCPGFGDRELVVRDAPTPLAGCVPKLGLAAVLAAPELLVDRALFRMRADELESFSIRAGERRLELVREGHGFRMRAPVEAQVAEDVGQARVVGLVEARGEWVTGDFAPPVGSASRVIELASSGATEGDVITEQVQIWELADGRAVARRESDGHWLRLTPTTLRAFSTDSLLVRKRQILELDDAKVGVVEVIWEGGRQVLRQPERGKFELTRPSGYQVDGGLAVALVDAVRQLTAEAWIAERDDGSFGFSDVSVQLKVTEASGETHEFVIGGRAGLGSYYAKALRSDPVFTLKASLVETLTTWLVARSGFMLDPALVDSLSLRSQRGTLQVKRLGSEYVQAAGDFQLGPAKLTALVDALSLLRPDAAVAFDAANRRYGFAKPTLEVSAKLTDGTARHWQIGVADTFRDGAVYYARIVGEDAVFVIPRQSILRIFDAV
jgi:Domain of unknown function (DUF4340)